VHPFELNDGGFDGVVSSIQFMFLLSTETNVCQNYVKDRIDTTCILDINLCHLKEVRPKQWIKYY